MKSSYLLILGIVVGLLLANLLPKDTSIFVHFGLAVLLGLIGIGAVKLFRQR
ncbi:hypothetical protein [Alteromonas facilis]|uniref:hypothetical protein n=1 Tax=Alteromonas facilis TaxID=2048004 RepID=UPI0013DCCF18|nr:hypothetical protein [Alteromonas facilis]